PTEAGSDRADLRQLFSSSRADGRPDFRVQWNGRYLETVRVRLGRASSQCRLASCVRPPMHRTRGHQPRKGACPWYSNALVHAASGDREMPPGRFCFMVMPFGRKTSQADPGKGPAEIDCNALWDK